MLRGSAPGRVQPRRPEPSWPSCPERAGGRTPVGPGLPRPGSGDQGCRLGREGWGAHAAPAVASRSCRSRASRFLQPALHRTVQTGKLRPSVQQPLGPGRPAWGSQEPRGAACIQAVPEPRRWAGRGALGAGTPAQPAPLTHLQPPRPRARGRLPLCAPGRDRQGAPPRDPRPSRLGAPVPAAGHRCRRRRRSHLHRLAGRLGTRAGRAGRA